MGCNVERVLGEIGQSALPMREAPRDGRVILGKTAAGLVICHWDEAPLKLAGPSWVETHDAARGYLDRYFSGWVDPAKLKMWDYAALADLLIAYIEDAHAAGDTKALKILDRRVRAFSGDVGAGSHSNQVYADCVDLSAVENAPE